MSDSPEQKPDSPSVTNAWFLKKNDGSEYGPETLETMANWAGESRIVSGNALSNDRKAWTPVEKIPELGMHWVAELPDGRRYGPFNILATRDLLSHKVLPPQARLVNRETGQSTTAKMYFDNGIVDLESSTANEEEVAAADDEKPAPKPAQKKTSRRKPKEEKNIESQNELFGKKDPPDGVTEPAAAPVIEEESHREDPEAAPETETANEAVADEVPEDAPETVAVTVGENSVPVEDEQEAEQPPATEELDEAEKVADDEPVPATEEPAVSEPAEPEPAEADAGTSEPTPEIDDMRRSLAELEEEKAAQSKELASLKRQIRRCETERDAVQVKLVEAEARMAEQTSALGDRAAEVDAALAAAEAKYTADLLVRDAKASEQAQRIADGESRLAAALEELKKAHKGEEVAKATLEEAEKKLARRVAIDDQKFKEVVRERNTLATLVETETSRILRLKMVLVLLAVALLALGITFLAGRGCRRSEEIVPGVSELLPDDSGAVDESSLRPRSGPPIIEGVKGIKVLYARTGGRIVFNEAVFSSNLTVAPQVGKILADLAPHLKRYMKDFSIVVVGYTDDQPPGSRSRYRTNEELALERAREFTRVISRECGIPITAMRAVSARDEEPPFPNTDAESRARNRTAVIKLVSHARD